MALERICLSGYYIPLRIDIFNCILYKEKAVCFFLLLVFVVIAAIETQTLTDEPYGQRKMNASSNTEVGYGTQKNNPLLNNFTIEFVMAY